MQRLTRSAFVAMALFMVIVPAFALTIVTVGGPCPGGGSWSYDIWVDDNRNVVATHGVMCGGESFSMNAGPAHLSGSNDWGVNSDFVSIAGDGTWIRGTVDALGKPIQMWGLSANGTYWMIDSWIQDGGGGGGVN